jgi:hypothetical protein
MVNLINKNSQKGGELTNTNKNKIKDLISSGNSELVFCDLRRPHPSLKLFSGIKNFDEGIPIIIVKKKNRINVPSNYYAIHKKDNDFRILTQGFSKEQFYNTLNSVKDKPIKNDDSVLTIKILIYFKINWIIHQNDHLCEEFYDLNRYFMSRIP